jgi:hypothetical protein
MKIKLHLNETIEWACKLRWIEFKFINLIQMHWMKLKFYWIPILIQFNDWSKVHLKRYGLQIGGEGIEKLLCS